MVRIGHACVFLGLLLPGVASAWDAETHYAWTYYVALQTGYTERQAHQIASADQAIADDPDTAIQPADWRDPSTALDPRARQTLRDLHCFAPELNGPPRNALEVLGWEPALHVPPSSEARLWTLAVKTGNPGPLVHYVQDCVIHRHFSDRFGQAAAGNFPNWIASSEKVAREMTFETARVLVKYEEDALGITPPPVDKKRLFEVLAKIADANPVYTSGIIGENGPPNPVDFLVQNLKDVPPAQAVAKREALEPALAKNFDTGRPSIDTAIRTIATAIHEDKVMGRLPGFDPEGWEPPPLSWLPYDVDSEGRPTGANPPWKLEQAGVSISGGSGFAKVTPPEDDAPDRLYTIALRQPYLLQGVLDLPPGGGAPVHESCKVSDTGKSFAWTSDQPQGDHAIVATIYRPASGLAEPLKWTCSVQIHGIQSASSVLEAPALPPRTIATETPSSDGAGPVAKPLADLVAARDDAMTTAGRVATACKAAASSREEATADEGSLGARIERARTAMAHAREAAAFVPTVQQKTEDVLAKARTDQQTALAKKKEAETAVRAACAAKGTPAAGEAAKKVEAARQAAEAASLDLDAQVKRIATWRDQVDALAREGRRLQDAVWALDPALQTLEASVDGARDEVRKRAKDATHLGDLAKRAADTAAAADTAWHDGGKPHKAKAALASVQALHAQVDAAAAHAACVDEEAKTLAALGDQVSSSLADSGDVASERAVLQKDLPTAELSQAMTRLLVKARGLQSELSDIHDDLIMDSDHATRCSMP